MATILTTHCTIFQTESPYGKHHHRTTQQVFQREHYHCKELDNALDKYLSEQVHSGQFQKRKVSK